MNDHGLTQENLVAALPVALQQDPSAVALAEALAGLLAQRPMEIDRLRLYPRIDRMPEELLDILARDFKVDWWDPNYSLEEKRNTVKSSWKVHKLLGTKAAVETAIRAIYPQSWAEPWFSYEDGKGRPYHFRLHVDLSDELLDQDKPTSVMERVRYYQSLRDHLDEIRYTIEAKQPAVLGLRPGIGANIHIGIPEGRDVYDKFRDTVRVVQAPMGVHHALGLSEDTAAPHRVSILRTGGSFVMSTPPPLYPTEEG